MQLGIEPTEQSALQIIRLAVEQACEITRLELALEEMTERCRIAEVRVFPGDYVFTSEQLASYLDKVRDAWECQRGLKS